MAEIIGSRLDRLIKDRGSSQSAVARALGISQPSVGRLISGETKESGKLIELSRLLRTSPEYLIGEVDDPDLQSSLGEKPLPFGAFPTQADQNADTIDLPELDVAYGMGSTYIHDAPVKMQWRTFSRAWVRQFTASPFDQIYWATSNGTSMMPAILDSDILLIDKAQQTPRMWDQFWAMEMHGLGMIKALKPGRDGSMRIVSINPDWPEEIAYDGELTVIGRVVAIVRKV